MRIVFFASNPTETSPLALGDEARDIESKIRSSDHRDSVSFITRWATRPDDLLLALNQDRPTVVHFSGHGTKVRQGIILHGETDGKSRIVGGKALKKLFSTAGKDVRLVVLNSCYSEDQARAVADIVDCVVGMRESIEDESARKFSASFYRALGFGKSVSDAFEQGLTSIALEGLDDEDVPQLLTREGINAQKIFLVPNMETKGSRPADEGQPPSRNRTKAQKKKGDPRSSAPARSSLEVSPEAQTIINDRSSSSWGVRLLCQILSEEIEASKQLKRELALGVSFGPTKRLADPKATQWMSEQYTRLSATSSNIAHLFNHSLKKAMGSMSSPGDAEDVIYVAKRIGAGYREIINWTLDWRKVYTSETLERLATIGPKVGIGAIEQIESWIPIIKTKIGEIEAQTHYQQGASTETKIVAVELSLDWTQGLRDEFEQETKRVCAEFDRQTKEAEKVMARLRLSSRISAGSLMASFALSWAR